MLGADQVIDYTAGDFTTTRGRHARDPPFWAGRWIAAELALCYSGAVWCRRFHVIARSR
jgi:hypothetical protein